MSDYASESGHFYDAATGEPRYRIVGANGVERDTTLRDAKKSATRGEPWVPGTTTITGLINKPGLNNWSEEQVLLAALTLPRLSDEPEAAWVKRVRLDAKEQAKKAAQRGTDIHAAIERYYATGEVDEQYAGQIEVVRGAIGILGEQQWLPEKSFASSLGYGGKVDLHSANVVLDFKTKDGSLDSLECYPEHYMQTAAGAHGLNIPGATCGIVFVRRDAPEARLIVHEADETRWGWEMFEALLRFWKVKNRI